MSLHSALSIRVMYSSNFFISSAFSSSVTCTSGNKENGIKLVYIYYWDDITPELVKAHKDAVINDNVD